MKKFNKRNPNHLKINGGGCRRRLIVTAFLLMVFVFKMPIVAQNTDSTNNYFYIVEQQDAYYDTLLMENGTDSMQGTGFKQYQRWKSFIGPRVDEDGDLSNYIEAVNSYYLATNPVASGYDWNYYGPVGLFDENVTGAGKGWVNRLLVDDDYSGKIWAGTHNSGLWQTTDGGHNWYLKTAQVPEITGISSMFRTNDEFVVNTSDMKSGIYLVSLNVNSSVLQSVKLSIIN